MSDASTTAFEPIPIGKAESKPTEVKAEFVGPPAPSPLPAPPKRASRTAWVAEVLRLATTPTKSKKVAAAGLLSLVGGAGLASLLIPAKRPATTHSDESKVVAMADEPSALPPPPEKMVEPPPDEKKVDPPKVEPIIPVKPVELNFADAGKSGDPPAPGGGLTLPPPIIADATKPTKDLPPPKLAIESTPMGVAAVPPPKVAVESAPMFPLPTLAGATNPAPGSPPGAKTDPQVKLAGGPDTPAAGGGGIAPPDLKLTPIPDTPAAPPFTPLVVPNPTDPPKPADPLPVPKLDIPPPAPVLLPPVVQPKADPPKADPPKKPAFEPASPKPVDPPPVKPISVDPPKPIDLPPPAAAKPFETPKPADQPPVVVKPLDTPAPPPKPADPPPAVLPPVVRPTPPDPAVTRASIASNAQTTFDVDLHDVRAGDTFASVSRKHLGDERYAEAIRLFNGGRTIRELTDVQIPPIHVLREKFPQAIAGRPADATPVSRTEATTTRGPFKTYTVPPGGITLKGIAKLAFGDDQQWVKVWDLNPKFKPNDVLAEDTTVTLPADSRIGR